MNGLLRGGRPPLLAAHRGVCGGNIPCNTERAFLAAVKQGADIIELDVTRGRDGTLWVFHPGMERAHLARLRPLQTMTQKAIARRHFVNPDRAKTSDRPLTFDDALELLKGKCLLNIDKFWTHPEAIAACIRRHNMEEQALVKIPAQKCHADRAAAAAPELPLCVMLRERDALTPYLLSKHVNYVGAELIFTTEDAPIVSEAAIRAYHEHGLAVWGNAIVYNEKDVISAGHTDDRAVTGDPDAGWGWFWERGFDIVQTDWLLAAKQYFGERHDNL